MSGARAQFRIKRMGGPLSEGQCVFFVLVCAEEFALISTIHGQLSPNESGDPANDDREQGLRQPRAR